VKLSLSASSRLDSSVRGARVSSALSPPSSQWLTLAHFSAQLERFVWDRGCA